MTKRAAIVLLFASSLTVMAGAVVAPSLPGVRTAFAQQPGVELLSRLLLSMPALGVIFSGNRVGRLVDSQGRRRILVAGLLIYGLGGSSGLYLPSLPLLLVGRLVLGVGVAAVMTSATTLIADLTAGSGRQRFLGMQAAFMGAGGLVFLTLGGHLADTHWRWPFAVYAVSFLLAPAVLAVIRPDGRHRHDGADAGPATHKVRHLYLAAVLGFALFFLLPVQLPFLLTAKMELSASRIGLTLGLMTLVAAMSSLAFVRLSQHLTPVGVLAWTFGLMAPGLAGLGLAPTWPGVLLGGAVFGAGIGMLTPNMNTWLAELVEPAQRGRALGNLNTATFIGQFISPLLVAPFLSLGISLTEIFVGGAVISALVALATALLLGRVLGRG